MTHEDPATWPEHVRTLPDEEATTRAAADLAPLLRLGDLVVLSGDLGAGKTFFVRALCAALGLDPDEPVTSPTFTLVHEYPLIPPVVHADLYRLSEPEEVEELGLEVRRDDAIVLVEWGAPFVRELGGGALLLDFSLEPRTLRIHGASQRVHDIVTALAEQERNG